MSVLHDVDFCEAIDVHQVTQQSCVMFDTCYTGKLLAHRQHQLEHAHCNDWRLIIGQCTSVRYQV